MYVREKTTTNQPCKFFIFTTLETHKQHTIMSSLPKEGFAYLYFVDGCWAAPRWPTRPALAQLQDRRARSQRKSHQWFNGWRSLNV